jgi:D-alanyl-D-alanine carboxypeptidase
MVKKISLVVAFILICNCTLRAQDFNKAKLDSFFYALNSHDKGMGSMAIAVNSSAIYQNAVGYSQINGDVKIPSTIKTKYRIGSITKMFTACIIFQLMEEGRLSLTNTLSMYFPNIPNATKITISEMLDHRSGLHDFTNDSVYTTYMTDPQTEPQMLAIIEKQKPDFEPDIKASYSSANFLLLGYIVEKLTGKLYKEEVEKRVISKIGLTDTYYDDKASPENNEAYSYAYSGGKWKQQPVTDMSTMGGAGSLVSTPTDLVKFINALFTGKIISNASLEQMKTMRDYYGMAMFTFSYVGKNGYGHSGEIDGFSSTLCYFPGDKLAIAYVSNGTVYPVENIMIAALNIYFNKPFTIQPAK